MPSCQRGGALFARSFSQAAKAQETVTDRRYLTRSHVSLDLTHRGRWGLGGGQGWASSPAYWGQINSSNLLIVWSPRNVCILSSQLTVVVGPLVLCGTMQRTKEEGEKKMCGLLCWGGSEQHLNCRGLWDDG